MLGSLAQLADKTRMKYNYQTADGLKCSLALKTAQAPKMSYNWIVVGSQTGKCDTVL